MKCDIGFDVVVWQWIVGKNYYYVLTLLKSWLTILLFFLHNIYLKNHDIVVRIPPSTQKSGFNPFLNYLFHKQNGPQKNSPWAILNFQISCPKEQFPKGEGD